jgi:hypothetical protein
MPDDAGASNAREHRPQCVDAPCGRAGTSGWRESDPAGAVFAAAGAATGLRGMLERANAAWESNSCRWAR